MSRNMLYGALLTFMGKVLMRYVVRANELELSLSEPDADAALDTEPSLRTHQ